jgi:hypothetical protein
MSEWSLSFTLTQNVNWGFLLSTTFPTRGFITQPRYIQMSSQGGMPYKETNNNPGLCPIKNNNWALVASLGSKINSRSCLCVLQGPRYNTKCWLSTQRLIFLLMFCLETPKKGSDPTNFWTEPSLASLSVVSLPRTPACSGTKYSPTACWVEISFNVFWQPTRENNTQLVMKSSLTCENGKPTLCSQGLYSTLYLEPH